MAKKNEKSGNSVSRRDFLKAGGAVAVGVQIGAVAGAGLAAGRDTSTLTGWQHLGDNTQFVNRKPLEIEGLPYKIVGTTRRCEYVESPFSRSSLVMRATMNARRKKQASEELDTQQSDFVKDIAPEQVQGESAPVLDHQKQGPAYPEAHEFPEPMLGYYKEHPGAYELDKIRMEEILPQRSENEKKYGTHYKLINAWSSAWGTSEPITQPPEISDFRIGGGRRSRPIPESVPFKSKKLASELIKKVTHHFGASMVGITKLNPDWCYNHSLRGSKERGSYDVPEHWKYVIAFGVPHQWEQMESNPGKGTSSDAYSRSTIAARRLENFIKSLGYAARRHSPMDGYDIIGVPVLVDAGLGQQGRHGVVITPETGTNFRAGFVTTNMPLEIDKPIDFGVNEFCQDCKICAEICPSQSISYEKTNEDMTTRGYRHWEINQTTCFNFWMQSMGGMGCRLCLTACPYSRKNNWAHALARKIDTDDPTGLVDNALIWNQKTFFDTPDASEFLPPPDGRFANYHEAPEWLSVEKYLDINTIDPSKGL